MNANPDMEGLAGETGADATPGTQPSAQPATPSAIPAKELKALLEPIIRETVERQFQSAKDKRIAGLQSKQDDFEERLARFEALTRSGKSRDEALSQINLEDKVAHLETLVQGKSSVPPPGEAGTSQAQAAEADPVLASMITALKIDPNTPEVTAILGEEATLPERIQKVLALSGAGVPASSTVPAGQRLPGTTGATQPVSNIDTIVSEMQALEQNPSKNWKRYQQLGDELARLLGPAK